MTLERDRREHRRETRRAECHGAFEVEAGRHFHAHIAAHPRLLGIAAPVALAHRPAGDDDLVALLPVGRVGRLHGAGQVDARNMRVVAHQARQALEDKAILVVHVGVGDADGYLALGQVAVLELLPDLADLAVGLLQHQRLEAHATPPPYDRVGQIPVRWPDLAVRAAEINKPARAGKAHALSEIFTVLKPFCRDDDRAMLAQAADLKDAP